MERFVGVFQNKAQRADALRTDLYQLTMAAAYYCQGMCHSSTFELFSRKLLPDRGYHIACGLELALRYIEGLKFTPRDVDALRRHPSFGKVDAKFFDYLADFRFTGDVWAMPEGTPYFPGEPMIRITAPVIEAQLLETYLLSVMNFQTLIATKAARVVQSAQGRSVIDFGTRRAHGPQAGELAARAAYIGGCDGTSNVEAGTALDIPIVGTYAHSWVMAFDDEEDAFRKYYEVFPESSTHLIDTYDTLRGAEKLVRLGIPIGAVRIDSGDLGESAKEVRKILDSGGYTQAKIVVSSDLNEYKIQELVASKAPIDVFGVGTQLVTSYDVPALGGVYKLVEQEEAGDIVYRMKSSAAKKSIPGSKQVWRCYDSQGNIAEDLIGLSDEAGPAEGHGLLERVIADGVRLSEAPSLKETRDYSLQQVAKLSSATRRLKDPTTVSIRYSRALLDLVERVSEKQAKRNK
jgi:nicotinate phosphoribosyltransferase